MNRNENDFINKISELLGSNKFEKFAENLENLFSGDNFPSPDEDEIYSQISDAYIILLKKLKINKFTSFCFSDYSDPRIVVVDGKKYDFDSLFSHNDSIAAECLCEIDALIADMDKNEETILKEIEKRMSKH